ncbi:hypothetical protein HOLleu_20163 [Holothuria leucospilota]|uniref:Uncharacterized protein n=1 Tax=Holothuria leucospilota TaxID=206669 RepID=A0A9Q1C0R2_HOLLE|nr:hypothetical protein HOLleu_20163 [Holothuria leucospilota]
MRESTGTGSYRDTVLVCTENADYKQFSLLAEKHRSKKEDFCFDDVILTLSKKQHDSLWSSLHQMCGDMQSQLRPQTGEDLENFNKVQYMYSIMPKCENL